MKITNLAHRNLCNICTNLSAGLNKLPGYECRSVSLSPPPYDFDVDILLKGNEDFSVKLIQESDLLHLNSWYFSDHEFVSKLFFYAPNEISKILLKYKNILLRYYINGNVLKEKKIILHYHGGDLRRKMSVKDKVFINKQGLKVLVTVPDLLPHLKNSQWLPIPVPTSDELYSPPRKRDDDVIKIVHSPTGREEKKTEVLIKSVEKLRQKYDVELILIENMSYRDCLRLKKEAHIAFDNIEFGSYAGCSVEAMCHEQPTLVYLNNVSQVQINKISEAIDIDPPFINIGDRRQPSVDYLNKVIEGKVKNIITKEDYRSVYENLELLIVDSSLRKELGKRGREWVKKVHDTKQVVEKLINIYGEIM